MKTKHQMLLEVIEHLRKANSLQQKALGYGDDNDQDDKDAYGHNVNDRCYNYHQTLEGLIEDFEEEVGALA